MPWRRSAPRSAAAVRRIGSRKSCAIAAPVQGGRSASVALGFARSPGGFLLPIARQTLDLDAAEADIGRHLRDAILDPDRTVMFERQFGEADRSRMSGTAAMLFDHGHANAVPGQEQPGGQADQTTSDDQHLCSMNIGRHM